MPSILFFFLGALMAAGPAPPAAGDAPATAVCQIALQQTKHEQTIDDRCLPALSADGKRIVVTRPESGSVSFLVLSVPGRGHELRAYSAITGADPDTLPVLKDTFRAVNRLLARGGFRSLRVLDVPRPKEWVVKHGGLELRFRAGRLEAWCGQTRLGQTRKMRPVHDDQLGDHEEVLTELFVPEPATFALAQTEAFNKENGFPLPGWVEWLLIPLPGSCP